MARTPAFRRAIGLPGDETDAMIRRVARFIDVAIWGLILPPSILMTWGVYDSLEAATKGLLALGFSLGSQRMSVGLVLVSAGVIYGAYLISWIFQKLIMDEVFLRGRMERGVRHSIPFLMNPSTSRISRWAGYLHTKNALPTTSI